MYDPDGLTQELTEKAERETRLTLEVPVIHNNGTAREDLVGGLCDARAAIHDAIKAVQQTAPNGRDYYPKGPEALERATKQHDKRIQTLADVATEVEKLADLIDEA
jgi:hypothetical protein